MPLRDPNKIPVEEYMNRKPITVQSDKPLLRALELMRRYNIQDIPVLDSKTERLCGILDRRQVGTRRLITSTTMVEDLMSPATRVSPQTSLPRVSEILLASDFRGLPVTYNHLMVGYISRRDIVRAIPQMMDLKNLRVEDIMSIEPMVARKADPLTEAVWLMQELGQRALPVVDDHGNLVGVLGKKALESPEVIAVLEQGETAPDGAKKGRSPSKKPPRVPPVGNYMNESPLTVERGEPVKTVVDYITKQDVSAVVVTEEGRPIGIVCVSDLLEMVASRSLRTTVYVQISGLPLEESTIYDDMNGLIQASMLRLARFTKPEMVNVNVVKHHGMEDEDKFTVRIRLNDSRKVYMTSRFDWDILNALQEGLDHLEILVRKDHDKRLDRKVETGRAAKGKPASRGRKGGGKKR